MPEILTESFCERCGTRYTFESGVPRAPRLKGIKVMSRGLKNFVMSDDTSMDEAMAAARSETDREVTSHQLDAFHKTFNFCMTCRQYTCSNCWNDAEGRCLSCAPNLGQEILPGPFPDLDSHGGFPAVSATNGANGHGAEANGHEALAPLDSMAWPTSDLMRDDEVAAAEPAPEPMATLDESGVDDLEPTDLMARLVALGAVETPVAAEPAPVEAEVVEAEIEAEAAGDIVPAPEAVAADAVVDAEIIAAEVEAETAAAAAEAEAAAAEPKTAGLSQIDPADVDGRAAAAAAQTTRMLARFRPGQSLDDEIAAFERELTDEVVPESEAVVTSETVVEPEPVVAAEPEPAVAAEPEVEPVAAEPEPIVAEPEPVAAAEPEPVVAAPEPEPEPVAATIEAEPVVAVEPEPIAAQPEPVAVAQPEPEPATAEPPVDVVAQPTWRIVAPDAPTADGVAAPAPQAPPSLPAEPVSATAEPEWPTQPEWPAQRPMGGGLPFLNRPATPSGGIEALWAESAREVVTAPAGPAARANGGVQPCVSCGLSLSANARFCRRCGTRQD